MLDYANKIRKIEENQKMFPIGFWAEVKKGKQKFF